MITLIKLGGSILQKEQLLRRLARELLQLRRKEKIIIVHGGGPEINKLFQRWGKKIVFHKGLRYTDREGAQLVEMALLTVNQGIVGELNRLKLKAVGLTGRDGQLLLARRISGLGEVGEPYQVKKEILFCLLREGFLPVIAPLGGDRQGKLLNINADAFTAALAGATRIKRVIFFTDVPGVLNSKGKVYPRLDLSQIARLSKEGVIHGGMLPKVAAAKKLLRQGVSTVVITSGEAGILSPRGTKIIR